MLFQTQIKLQNKLFLLVLFSSSILNAVAYSTVSPYIKEAQEAIDAQVTTGMDKITIKVNQIHDSATSDLKPQYTQKQKTISNIKIVQAQNLLLLKKIESDFSKTTDLKSNANVIEVNGAASSLTSGEKESVSVSSEKFK